MIIPKKSLGQNFLKDKNIAIKILHLTNIENENIIEVGPGFGMLTDEILKLKPKNIILIEKDKKIYNYLLKKYSNENILIINKDILNFNFKNLINYKIISNLPYNISSKFILKTIKYNKNIYEILCMIQSELAKKFDYNDKKMNKYKFLSKYLSKYEMLFDVSPNVFYPKPKVNSKVVRFILKKQYINTKKLDLFIKYFFINKRKKIKSNKYLSNIINKKFIDKRYEDLSYIEILEVYKKFNFSFS